MHDVVCLREANAISAFASDGESQGGNPSV